MINFNQLRGFYYVARYLNHTLAAQKLYISQPTVTSQVKLFEDSCGLKLFKKKGRKIYLTGEGKAGLSGLGKPLLCNPDWTKKAIERREEDIVKGIYCNHFLPESIRKVEVEPET